MLSFVLPFPRPSSGPVNEERKMYGSSERGREVSQCERGVCSRSQVIDSGDFGGEAKEFALAI